MQTWLIDLIDIRRENEPTGDDQLANLFDFKESPEGFDFWKDVVLWQCGSADHPAPV